MSKVQDVPYKFIEVGMRSVARTTIFTMQARKPLLHTPLLLYSLPSPALIMFQTWLCTEGKVVAGFAYGTT